MSQRAQLGLATRVSSVVLRLLVAGSAILGPRVATPAGPGEPDLPGSSAAAAIPATPGADGGRVTVSLDGVWQLAEGSTDAPPAPEAFRHDAPVPGLADMATPAIEGVGVKDADPRRQAFWYRRTFRVAGAIPASATLEVRKARYGARVLLNGSLVGDHVPCFTAVSFDVRPWLKGEGGENEILIRVGASRTAVPETVPWGHDFEKVRYIPGIYDSVGLVLSGSPRIVRVQTAPDLAGSAVRVAATVRAEPAGAATGGGAEAGPAGAAAPGDSAGAGGAGGAAGSRRVRVAFTVREARTGAVAGSGESDAFSLAPGEERTIEVSVSMRDVRPWSPDDPFLYEVETSTGADSLRTRFGMRTFSFDREARRALLNGKPCYLRGTNICIDRFFEDPLRGDKPWREDWVRSVIRAFRGMHWNSCRYCIGFPPEVWYRVADEEGLMVQDEFPVWGQTGSLEALTAQYADWLRERWNHPCVVIWDAQNETANQDITGRALAAVRGMDLSDRPWDNGWAPPVRPTDVYEAHPYAFSNPAFRMRTFERLSPRAGSPGSFAGNPLPNAGDNPVVINEYGWLWLNRDGTPTTLTTRAYERLFPDGATPDERRETYARLLAAKTEFWRCGRQVAGVLHFCGLGYSRAGGQTSDNFVDIETPTFEPHFHQYVRDAFSPVGLMIDFWSGEMEPASRREVRVVVIDDLDREWAGPVTLRMVARRGRAGAAGASGAAAEAPLLEKTVAVRVAAFGRESAAFEVEAPAGSGAYRLVAELTGADGRPVRSLRDFETLSAEDRARRYGLAVGKKVVASSSTTQGGETYPAALAVDGDTGTRWSSDFSDPQWIAVDLGAPTRVSRVELEWEAAYGKAYEIQVSTDGETWTDVHATDAGKGGFEVIRFAPVEARWIRYHGTARGTQFGHSLWELRVFP